MTHEKVDNAWFVADFPSKVEVTVEASDGISQTTEFAAETQPFGIFVVRATQMPVDPFVAAGARKWVELFGDDWVKNFAQYNPEILRDLADTVVGGARRELVFRMDYQGTCGAFTRIVSHPDGYFGRILVCSAVVDWAAESETSAFRFLNSVRAKWLPAR